MNRVQMLECIKNNPKVYDFIIIGGGATGIGIALEAVTRGYSVLLLEKSDFTKSTSSKSTKLIHGGVRYLAQGNLALVREALKERGLLIQNAPHLVRKQSFIIPTQGWFDELKYSLGLTFYDLLAGKLSLGRSKYLSKTSTLTQISTINPKKISGGVVYQDGQFDDSRLAINTIQTAVEHGAFALNYCPVIGLIKNAEGQSSGIRFSDVEEGKDYQVMGKQIVNATGVFADDILKMDSHKAKKTMIPSQGIHLVLDKSFLPENNAIMIPKTEDGRVLFLVPWYGKVIAGTTDTLIQESSLDPIALEDEIAFILKTMDKYLTKTPQRNEVLSVFAGLRPLAAAKSEGKKTKEISRSHKIFVSKSGLLTMVGGKWTTFRKMGEDLVDKTEKLKGWTKTTTKTEHLKIHGYQEEVNSENPLSFYGSDEKEILALASKNGGFNYLSSSLEVIEAQVIWATKYEMARTVEDFLARRTRCLLLDAKESLRMAPQIATIMASELNKDEAWQEEQIKAYEKLASNYILS